MKRPLRILSWQGAWGTALRNEVSIPFQEATGVAVEAVSHVGLHLPPALVHALETRDEPPVDVVWCNTSPALRAAERGWCEPLDELPILRQLADRARPTAADSWHIAPTYVTHYVLVYRSRLYPEKPPDTWRVLEDARHAGRVVLYPGGNGFHAVAQILGGGSVSSIPEDMSACWATVTRMRRQIYSCDYSIGLSEPIRRGQIDLCYRALPNVLAFQTDGLDVEWAAPQEGIADTTDAMWVPRGLEPDIQERARQYIAFALSAEIQGRWCKRLGVLPLNRNARERSDVFERGRLPLDPDDLDNILYIPEPIKAANEPAWADSFKTLVDG